MLTPSGSRIVVRDWLETPLSAARANLASFFERQAIPGGDGRLHRYGLPAMERSLRQPGGHRRRGEVSSTPPFVATALLRKALLGEPLPPLVLRLALRRAGVTRPGPTPDSASRRLGRPLAAVIKLALAGDGRTANAPGVTSEPQTDAELCGRLLALLEATRRSATDAKRPAIGDGVFSLASAAPAAHLGPLLRRARHHLARIARASPQRARYFGAQIADVSARIGVVPARLTPREQGRFALGYYYQRAGVGPATAAAPAEPQAQAA